MSSPTIVGSHTWVASALVVISDQEAKAADNRGYYKTGEKQRIDVLETYCRVCRRRYEEAADTECEVGQVLRGGPIDTRKRRQSDDDDAAAEPRTLSALAG